MVFVSYCPKSSPTPLFLSQNKNQHPILSLCTKFELNWLRNKKVTKKPHFRWNEWEIREPELEMMSYLDNAYDVTDFCCFEKFLAYTLFSPSFIVVRHQIAGLTLGEGFLPPPHPI